MKKGFVKTEDKSYQLQKLAEQRKMATVSPTGRPLFQLGGAAGRRRFPVEQRDRYRR